MISQEPGYSTKDKHSIKSQSKVYLLLYVFIFTCISVLIGMNFEI